VFKGNITIYGGEADDGQSARIPLNENNLLLKSAVLKNTAWILGVVIYAGPGWFYSFAFLVMSSFKTFC